MPVVIQNNKKILFVHIPKTGGTTINRFLDQNCCVLLSFSGTPEGFKCAPQHLEAKSLREILPINDMDGVFSVVRHPEDRVVSEFLWRLKGSRYKQILANVSNQKVKKNIISNYFSFWIKRHFFKYSFNSYHLSNHLRPQKEFILGPFQKIYKIEDGIEAPLRYIRQTLEISRKDGKVERLNASKGEFFHISKSLRLRIERFYASDYEQFSYDRRS